MKKIFYLIILNLSFYGLANSQTPLISDWENFDPQTHTIALVPSNAVANQFANSPSGPNCHAYSTYLAMGSPVPSSYGCCVPTSDLNTRLSSGDIEWSSPEDATHVGWFIASQRTFMFGSTYSFDGIQHSAIMSQFDAFPASDGYCQGVNGPHPELTVHKISDYDPNQNYVIDYFRVSGSIIPPNLQPVTPSSIFSCEAFQMSSPDCINSITGEAAIANSSSSNNSTYTWDWSNGGTNANNINLTAGTYTATVTESPSNYYCVSSVTLTDQSSFFSHFSYVPHNVMYGCYNGNQGTGSATVNLANGYSVNDFSFQWDQNAQNQQSSTASGLCSNSFTVTITSNNTGCTEIHTANVPIQFGSQRKRSSGIVSENLTESENLEITTFPNPVENKLNIEGLKANSDITIFDLKGRVVLHEIATSKVTLNTSTLTTGIYMLRISNQDGEVINKKISKL